MSNKLYIFLAALVGALCGFLTIHSFLAHSWTSIIFWIVIGLIVVYFSSNRKAALYAGASFGFFNIATWLISGFQGAADQIRGFMVLTVGLSIAGVVCGALGALLFYWLFR